MTNPVAYPITTVYRKPGDWAAGYHTGEDRACPNGTDAFATRDCVVVEAGWYRWGRAYGLGVVMEATVNGQKLRCLYAHMQSINVSVGQKLLSGAKVGDTNNTGNTTGPHLHQEVRHYPYAYGDDVNPALWNTTLATIPPPNPGTLTVFDVSFWAMAYERWFGTSWEVRAEEIKREIQGQEAGTEASAWGFTEMYDAEQIQTLTEVLVGFQRVPGQWGLEFWYDRTKWQEERPPRNYASGVQNRGAMVVHLTRKSTGQHVCFVVFHGPITYDSLKTKYGQWLARLLSQIDGPILLMGDANRSVKDESPRKEIYAAGFRDMRDQAVITNESAKEFPSRGWNLSDIWTDLNDQYDDKIVGGEIDLTSARVSDHRRIEARVSVRA